MEKTMEKKNSNEYSRVVEENTENNKFFTSLTLDTGGYLYEGWKNADDFIEVYSKLIENKEYKPLYELVQHSLICKEFYDIDMEYDYSITTKNSQDIFNKFNSLRDHFLKTIDAPVNFVKRPEWRITDSSKLGKVSLHIVNLNLRQ
jgi:hypothetical protein